MKAIILEKAGGVENMMIKNIDQPVVGKNEVLVGVEAISINPVDFKVRENEQIINFIYGDERPVILGWDIAGSVVKVGDKVTKFEKGHKVFGMVNFPGTGKAYAEYVVSPEDHLAKIPENISIEEAAATTLAALTALQVLNNRVKKGDHVLIHAGSGGVGHYAIQIAKHFGAYVVTTSSSKNRDFVKSLGADEHIDYRTQDFEEVVTDIDFVLDGIGGDVLLKSLQVLKEGGSLVSIVAHEFPEEVVNVAQKRKISISSLMVQSNGKDMDMLKTLLENGTVKAHVSKTFPFEEMAQAHKELESGRTIGKVVVKL